MRGSSGSLNSVMSVTHFSLGAPAWKSWVPSPLSGMFAGASSSSPAYELYLLRLRR